MFTALYSCRKRTLVLNVDLCKAQCPFSFFLCSENDASNLVPGNLEHAVDERYGKWLW